MFNHGNDETIKRLEAAHPGWHVWVIHRTVGGPLWCARREGEATASLHPEDAEDLSARIKRAERGQR
ncbi:MAG TPA: hypothetical protein VGJ54_17650 [Streptosporangiaceae bacterium]|jgi:hypothetical protein